MFADLEAALAEEDWAAIASAEPVLLEAAPEDEQELRRLIAEADRLQRLIGSYLAQVHHDIEMAPQLRRAATAYTRGEGLV